MDAEIGVIGMGTMGSMAMWQLARQGVSVMGFDQFGIGHDRSAGGGESRIFRTTAREGHKSVPLIQEALHQWRELENETNNELLTITKGLLIGSTDESIIKNAIESIKNYGLEHDILNREEAEKQFPQHRLISDEVMIVDKFAGIIRPELAIISAIKRAEELGAGLHNYTKVEKIIPEENSVKVHAGGSEYKFRKVLITTGPWTGELFSSLKNTITVRRLLSTWFATKKPSLFAKERFPVFSRSTNGKYFYGVPSMDGFTVKISVGAKLEDKVDNPNLLNRNLDISDLNEITGIVKDYLPDLLPDPVRINVYMEGYTQDRNPLIGKSPWSDHVVLACGFSGHGFKYSPAIGKIVADILIEGKTNHSIDHFSPSRFFKKI